jgi:hypothetical protein
VTRMLDFITLPHFQESESFTAAGTKRKNPSEAQGIRFISLDDVSGSDGFPFEHHGSSAAIPIPDHQGSRNIPHGSKPVPRKKVSREKAEKKLFEGREEFDLTVWRVPTIIVCTSILWRADKPGKERGL